MAKPILVLDFDGVLHSYTSGWQGITSIPDPPVAGMVLFLRDAVDLFDVQILSSRSKDPNGISAMKYWLAREVQKYYDCWTSHGAPRDFDSAQKILDNISFPTEKPAAFLTIDDRAICFDGKFPDPVDLLGFKPWYKRIQVKEVAESRGHQTQIIQKALMAMKRVTISRRAR